jgi:hypothetical protein
MVGAIADGDRHTRAMSNAAVDCRDLRRGKQQIFAISPGDGEVTLFGSFLLLQEAGPALAYSCDEEPLLKLGKLFSVLRYRCYGYEGSPDAGENA